MRGSAQLCGSAHLRHARLHVGCTSRHQTAPVPVPAQVLGVAQVLQVASAQRRDNLRSWLQAWAATSGQV